MCIYRSNVEMLEMAIFAILSGVTSEDDAFGSDRTDYEFDGLGESGFWNVICYFMIAQRLYREKHLLFKDW